MVNKIGERRKAAAICYLSVASCQFIQNLKCLLAISYWLLAAGCWLLPMPSHAQPKNLGSALFQEGNSLFNEGKYPEAVASYKQALQENPNAPKTYHNLGLSYMAMGPAYHHFAKLAFQKAVSLQPDFISAYYNLGVISYKDKDIKSAKFYFNKVLSMDADHVEARSALWEISQEQDLSVKQNAPPPSEQGISVDFREADIQNVLRAIAEKAGVNIVAHESVKGTITVKLKNVTLKHALDVVLLAYGFSYEKIDNTIFTATPDKIRAGDDFVREIVKLEYADPVEVQRILIQLGMGTPSSIQIYQGGTTGLDTGGAATSASTTGGATVSFGSNILGSQVVNSNTSSSIRNILLLVDRKEVVQKIKEFIMQLDGPPTPLVIEARFEELILDDQSTKEMGIEWLTQNIPLNFTEQDPGLVPGRIQTFGRSALEIRTLLDALQQKGKAKTLARPSISTVDGKVATFFAGRKIPFQVTERDQFGNIVVTERFTADSNVGIRLQIIPRVNEGDLISIDVLTEVASPIPDPSGGLPTINTRTTRTFLRLKDGETMVIGGLLNQEESQTLTEVPILSSLPIVGNLFKNSSVTRSNSEVMIFITPRIIKKLAAQ